VSYNQRGCGPSSCDGSFDIHEQVDDLDCIRAHLGASRMHLFGHSYGGLLGQLYAKAHPERIASLVLCCSMANTGAKVAQMESKGIAERVMAGPRRSRAGWVIGGLMMQFPGRLGDHGFGLAMKQLLPNYVVRRGLSVDSFNMWYGSKRAWRGTNRSIKALGDDYVARSLLDAPVLILQGEQDVIRETNAVLAERFPHATNIRVDHAGHFPWVEQPETFSKALLDFYRKAAAIAPV
jgi:proline iminopeptidase